MTEGDLAAGELEVPVEWLESLAQGGRVLYLEQGLWIAAEEADAYEKALGGIGAWQRTGGSVPCEGETGAAASDDTAVCEAQLRIVRRMLRYRGAADAGQTAQRYGWHPAAAEEILEKLCQRSDAVRQEDKYYHVELYRRARVQTLKNRREEIRTCPAETYAALMLSHMESSAPADDSSLLTPSTSHGTQMS